MIRYSERTGFCLGTERHCSAPLRAPSALMGSCSAGFLACAGPATEEASIKRTADPPPRQTGEFYFTIIGEIQRAIGTAGHARTQSGRPAIMKTGEFSNAIFWGELLRSCHLFN